jgi:putative heme iron utilization protein
MSTTEVSAPRQHASTGPAGPVVPEPSHAERSRTLLSLVSVGMLSTMSKKLAGFPFGSLMPFALDSQGRAIFLISNMAMHTQNLREDGRCSLFVMQAAADGDPLGAARATLVGNAAVVPDDEKAEAREIYLAQHANASYWVDFADFHFFRLTPVDMYYVGGFGVMGWVEAQDFAGAKADPLAEAAAGIMTHMNADHVESMVTLAKAYAGIEGSEAAMTSVDRLGFTLRLKTAEGMKGPRINFTREVGNAQETRMVLVEMVKAARAKELA